MELTGFYLITQLIRDNTFSFLFRLYLGRLIQNEATYQYSNDY